MAAFSDRIEYARTTHVDHKTELQEALAKSGRSVTYAVLDDRGPGARAVLLLRGADRRRGAGDRHGPDEEGRRAGGGQDGARSDRRDPGGLVADSSLWPSDPSAAPASLPPVHLRSIRLRGFKSFPDALELKLEPGVAVVVGPNGSGKSNVADAIVWAAGSLTPSELRAEKPDDVLFNGAEGRTAAESCEVELVFDNESGGFGELDFSEVSIARRLHRGGEGQYLVNKAQVRRTDLVELLADVGLGGSMHSIVSQGKVEAVLASKPDERRELVEEAAGLGKFKQRRHRAELKLARVAIQVERARDVEAEVRKRLRPLALQATAAERAEKLAEEIAALRARIAELDLAAADARREAAEERKTAAGLARRSAQEKLQALLAERHAAEEELADAAGRREAAIKALYRLQARPSESRSARRARRAARAAARRPRRGRGRGASRARDDAALELERPPSRAPRARRGRECGGARAPAPRRSASLRATSARRAAERAAARARARIERRARARARRRASGRGVAGRARSSADEATAAARAAAMRATTCSSAPRSRRSGSPRSSARSPSARGSRRLRARSRTRAPSSRCRSSTSTPATSARSPRRSRGARPRSSPTTRRPGSRCSSGPARRARQPGRAHRQASGGACRRAARRPARRAAVGDGRVGHRRRVRLRPAARRALVRRRGRRGRPARARERAAAQLERRGRRARAQAQLAEREAAETASAAPRRPRLRYAQVAHLRAHAPPIRRAERLAAGADGSTKR